MLLAKGSSIMTTSRKLLATTACAVAIIAGLIGIVVFCVAHEARRTAWARSAFSISQDLLVCSHEEGIPTPERARQLVERALDDFDLQRECEYRVYSESPGSREGSVITEVLLFDTGEILGRSWVRKKQWLTSKDSHEVIPWEDQTPTAGKLILLIRLYRL